MNTKILTTSKEDIAAAGEILRRGGLVAFPTETVYGLGADALNADAVKKIYAAKGRPSDNPLIVHIAEKEDIIPLVEAVTPQAQALMDAFFPAPLTIILKKSPLVSDTVSGGLDTVAVRMPQNETARAIIRASGCPIAAPSANTSGLPSPTKAAYVMDDMMGKVDAIVDGGDCSVGVESTVITLAGDTPTILRPGAVTKEMLESVLGEVAMANAVLQDIGAGETAASPGMKYKHYAPRAKVYLVNADKAQYEAFVNTRKNAYALCFEGDNVTIPHLTYGREHDGESQAKELFGALRQLDECGAAKVYARLPDKSGVGMAVYNRLIRAAAFRIIDLTKPFTLGLTGPTGAGKGHVGALLQKRGFKIIDSDAVYRRLTQPGSPLLQQIADAFGADVLKDGALERKALGAKVFANSESKEKLNALVHPAILQECAKEATTLCVLDAPQLFEAHGEEMCYKVLAVTAPQELRLQRIIRRDGITKEQALSRMGAQLSEAQYISRSDYVIVNDGQEIETQIDKILDEIL